MKMFHLVVFFSLLVHVLLPVVSGTCRAVVVTFDHHCGSRIHATPPSLPLSLAMAAIASSRLVFIQPTYLLLTPLPPLPLLCGYIHTCAYH